MKSPFKKLRDLAVSKHNKVHEPSSLAEELLEPDDVTQDMESVESIRSQYEGLLTNAHIISGAAYDFSRSVQDMASHMLEAFGQYIDGEIGHVFSMLAKVQFEISKLLDIFAAHVSQTIITPTEKMIGEIQQVQVMKEQYDEKRNTFNLLLKDMQKGKPKSGKVDNMNRLASAKEEFNEQGQVLSFRLQSVTQGQSRSLITQAARYHSAQMHLFSKGLASITAMEPVMRQLALEKNIDRSMSEAGISNDVSFEDVQEVEDASKYGVDSESLTSSPTALLETQDGAAETPEVDMAPKKLDPTSKSAPISSSMYHQKETSRILETSLEASGQKKLSMYALPSPSNTGQGVDSSKQNFGDSSTTLEVKKPASLGKPVDSSTKLPFNASRIHGMPAEQNAKHAKRDEKLIRFNELTNDVNVNKIPKMSRSYSHSGSISNKRLPGNRRQNDNISSSTASHLEETDPLYRSGPVSRSPMPMFASPRSQNVAPNLLSLPQISELHKLPPPPSPNSTGLIAHSAPLGKKAHEAPQPKSGPTSPLPPPPLARDLGARSLSIPALRMHVPESQEESAHDSQEGFPSPPLKPLVLPVTMGML
ncbi:hypothetical protein GOP47_0016406 [Adiantum capillus-veneris]|uniref:BAR domain-containing protein n=1 Tax=Adiantum capillus-veneris TaxID=13818 RepID=A0A9D4UHL4_ADICA|nr:hypothetical protein GOP47_0016406 [Adiantum capillus-veneris]